MHPGISTEEMHVGSPSATVHCCKSKKNYKINRLRVRRRAILIPLTLNLMHQGEAKVQKSLLVKHIPSLLLIKVLFPS
jgi:hypothetical protein